MGNWGAGGGGALTTGGGAAGVGRNSEQPPNTNPPIQTANFRIFMGSYLQQSWAVRQLVMRPRGRVKVRREVAGAEISPPRRSPRPRLLLSPPPAKGFLFA